MLTGCTYVTFQDLPTKYLITNHSYTIQPIKHTILETLPTHESHYFLLWLKVIIFTLQSVPWGFYKVIKEVSKLYNQPPIFITGNGWSSGPGLVDENRINYFKRYMNAMLNAINEGCQIKAYSVWSMMDNFEWTNGFTWVQTFLSLCCN